MTWKPALRGAKASAAVNAWPFMLHRKITFHTLMSQWTYETRHDQTRPRSARTNLPVMAGLGSRVGRRSADRGDWRHDHVSRAQIRRFAAANRRHDRVRPSPWRWRHLAVAG